MRVPLAFLSDPAAYFVEPGRLRRRSRQLRARQSGRLPRCAEALARRGGRSGRNSACSRRRDQRLGQHRITASRRDARWRCADNATRQSAAAGLRRHLRSRHRRQRHAAGQPSKSSPGFPAPRPDARPSISASRDTMRLFIRPLAGSDISLYPDPPGLGSVAGAALQVLPFALDEIAKLTTPPAGATAARIVRAIGDALDLRSGSPLHFDGVKLEAWAANPAQRFADRLPLMLQSAVDRACQRNRPGLACRSRHLGARQSSAARRGPGRHRFHHRAIQRRGPGQCRRRSLCRKHRRRRSLSMARD